MLNHKVCNGGKKEESLYKESDRVIKKITKNI